VPGETELAIISYLQGQAIFSEGDVGTNAYIVEKGSVEIWRKGDDGSKIIFATLGPGSVFGELALINPAPRAANATSVDVSTLIVVPKFVLDVQMKKSDAFIRKMMLALIDNVRRLTDRIDQLEGTANKRD